MIEHDGFTLTCDSYAEHHEDSGSFHADSTTERTAITKAREKGWFVGHVRITSGRPKSKIRTVRRVLCPMCKWLVGA